MTEDSHAEGIGVIYSKLETVSRIFHLTYPLPRSGKQKNLTAGWSLFNCNKISTQIFMMVNCLSLTTATLW